MIIQGLVPHDGYIALSVTHRSVAVWIGPDCAAGASQCMYIVQLHVPWWQLAPISYDNLTPIWPVHSPMYGMQATPAHGHSF